MIHLYLKLFFLYVLNNATNITNAHILTEQLRYDIISALLSYGWGTERALLSLLSIRSYFTVLHLPKTNFTEPFYYTLSNRVGNVRELNVSLSPRLTDQKLIPLLKGATALEMLYINECTDLTDETLYTIANYNKKLKLLNISYNSKMGAGEVLDYLVANCPKLECLHIVKIWRISEQILSKLTSIIPMLYV